jgi:hypothetical protein
MFGGDPQREAAPMLVPTTHTSQIQPTAAARRHEFAYPSVTPVAVRAHTILASSLARLADPVRPGTSLRAA